MLNIVLCLIALRFNRILFKIITLKISELTQLFWAYVNILNIGMVENLIVEEKLHIGKRAAVKMS